MNFQQQMMPSSHNSMGVLGSSEAMGMTGQQLPTHSNWKVEMVRLILQETGTYNDQYVRSYQTDIQKESMVGDLLQTIEQCNFAPTSGAFDAMASSILTVKPHVSSSDAILVPNGWGAQRIRFFLEVRETEQSLNGGVYLTYVQGFTDSFGVNTYTGAVTPEMRFFPNTFFRMQRYTEQTPHGPRQSYRVVASGQVLNGVLTMNPEVGHSVQYMRPVDVLGGVQRAYDKDLVTSDVIDIRNMNPGGYNTVYSSFSNNTASEYLSRLITPLARGALQVGFGPGHTTFVDSAVGMALGIEPTNSSSKFLELMVRQLNPMAAACFTMAELAQLDPTIGQRTQYKPVEKRYVGSMSQRGVGEYWNQYSAETVVAAKVVNSLPGLMWEHFVGMVSFSLTNRFGPPPVLSWQHLYNLTESVPRGYTERFIAKLQETLASDLTLNMQQLIDIDVNASVLGDVSIQVSVDNSPKKLYQAPAFGSGILNPVYSRDNTGYNNLINGLQTLAAGIETISSRHGTPSGGLVNSL